MSEATGNAAPATTDSGDASSDFSATLTDVSREGPPDGYVHVSDEKGNEWDEPNFRDPALHRHVRETIDTQQRLAGMEAHERIDIKPPGPDASLTEQAAFERNQALQQAQHPQEQGGPAFMVYGQDGSEIAVNAQAAQEAVSWIQRTMPHLQYTMALAQHPLVRAIALGDHQAQMHYANELFKENWIMQTRGPQALLEHRMRQGGERLRAEQMMETQRQQIEARQEATFDAVCDKASEDVVSHYYDSNSLPLALERAGFDPENEVVQGVSHGFIVDRYLTGNDRPKVAEIVAEVKRYIQGTQAPQQTRKRIRPSGTKVLGQLPKDSTNKRSYVTEDEFEDTMKRFKARGD